MVKRLIDANALMELYELGEELEEQVERLNVPIPVIRQNIKDAPTVGAVEEVHGKWIIGTGENALMQGYRMCSVCGEIIKTQYSLFGVFNYCHYCGTEMDGGKDG